MITTILADNTNTTTPDGLRYIARANTGIPPADFGAAPRSCLKCGAFRLPSQLRTFKLAGKVHLVCGADLECKR